MKPKGRNIEMVPIQYAFLDFYDEEGVWIHADGLINDFKEYMKGE